MSEDFRQRFSPDGANITKNDPGTPDTDPEYYATTATISQDGSNMIDLNWHSDPTTPVYLQTVILQVSGAAFGDRVRVHFMMSGSSVNDFGWMNVPLATSANGWSVRTREPGPEIGTAKFVPAGVGLALEYDAVDAGQRQIAIDLVAQE